MFSYPSINLETVAAAYWTSLNDHFKLQKFFWESTGEAYAYNNFFDGAPSLSVNPSCTILGLHLPELNVRYWFNTLCNYEYRYICEKHRETCSFD